MEFRGYHYDIARGAFLKPETFVQAMRLAADNGFTHFVPYLESMIRLPSIARSCPEAAYTPAQWRGFDATARLLGLQLVPHVNVIGHTTAICRAYPELAAQPGDTDLDPRRPVVQAWTERCLAEFCDCSSGDFFLIGGDEWQPPSHCLLDPTFDPGRAWVEQVNRAVDYLATRGRTAIVWHDMLMHYPAVLQHLSRQAVIAFWYYDYDSDYPVLGTFKAMGFRTIMASGMFGRQFTRRAAEAMVSARQAMRAHAVDGFLMTAWEITPWEAQSAAIPLAADALQARPLPGDVLAAGSLDACLAKVPAGTEGHQRLQDELRQRAGSPEWTRFPLHQKQLHDTLSGDVQALRESFGQYHRSELVEPDGYFARYAATLQPPVTGTPADGSFGLRVCRDPALGDCLHVQNGDERFTLYPSFGPTLQDWTWRGHTLVPPALSAAVARELPPPGGYRGWSRVGGLRPIWAIGTHHCPCILWQHPWRWEIETRTADAIVLHLRADFAHVEMSYRIGVRRGVSGVDLDLAGTNLLPHLSVALNFNLPLQLSPYTLHATRLLWTTPAGPGRRDLLSPVDEAFWVEAPGGVTIATPDWQFAINSRPDDTAGFFVDWNSTFITPDLHGRYRPLAVGETLRSHWHLGPTAAVSAVRAY